MQAFTVLSTNQIKIRAFRYALDKLGLNELIVSSAAGSSGVSAQPLSLEETLQGARNRAMMAYQINPQAIGVGIECGVFQVFPEERLFNISCAVMFDGKNYLTGMSPTFLHPESVTSLVLDQGLDISQAYREAGLCISDDIGASDGAIGIISNGNMPRYLYCSLAAEMALYDWLNSSYNQ